MIRRRILSNILSTAALICLFSAVCVTPGAAQSISATFGQVVALGGTPSDLVLDESRQRIYLINNAANRVDVFAIGGNSVIRSVNVGRIPLAGAMSMDNAFLYVTNQQDSSVSIIDLNSLSVTQTVSLPAAPQGIEIGADGRALVSTAGTTGGANTLLIVDRTQAAGNAVTSVVTPPPPSTPTPLPPTTLTRPDTTFFSKLIRTPDGTFIIGLTNPSTTQTYLFVYEVASGTILRSRTVTGQSTVLSVAPDGSRFMAGFTLYDTSTLSVIAQMNNANAPFPFTANFNTRQNIGGSVFSPDGSTVIGAFNITPFSNPAAAANASTMLISDSRNLGIQLGIKLPESIVAKVVITADGSKAWSLSESGMLYLPLAQLYSSPLLVPETTQVFLAVDACNPGLAQATLKINNLGKGKLTFSVATISNSLVSSVKSGVAPSTITFTMEPGRTGIVRQAGTNLATGGTTLSGLPFDVTLASVEAINIAPTIRVYMNYRNLDQRGIIYPVPTTPNNSPNAAQITGNTALVGGDQGLRDILLDSTRNRVYLTNAGYNRIEVFDTQKLQFLTPIPVGQLPNQMAVTSDNRYLYVGSGGGELISIVDLNVNQVIGTVSYPPLPRQAGGATAALITPTTLAMGTFGLQFIMSNGTQWSVLGNVATPRPSDSATKQGNNTNTIPSPAYMLNSQDGQTILRLGSNGTGYLYNGLSDTYVATRAMFGNPIQSFYGPLSVSNTQDYILAGGLILNNSLTVIGGAANPSVNNSSPIATRNVVGTFPYDNNNYIRFSTTIRANVAATSVDEPRPTLDIVNVPTNSVQQLGVAPENPRYTLFGNTRFNISPRTMVVDTKGGNAYVISLSGLSVIPLTLGGAPRPTISTGGNKIVDSTTNTPAIRVGGFITVNGSNLAGAVTASTVPAPTVLGGSCVLFNDIALPLIRTAAGSIQAQIPATVNSGTNVVQVRSLANGTQSDPVVVTVLAPTGSGTPGGTRDDPAPTPGPTPQRHVIKQ